MAPLPGSLAIDTGNNAAATSNTDQTGAPRIVNGVVDIGSIENDNTGPPTINPVSFPDGDPGNSYSANVVVSGPGGPYSFSITQGALPDGLSITSTGSTGRIGILSGTPTTAGTFTFTLSAADSSGDTGSRDYTLKIDPAIVVNPSTLPTGFPGSGLLAKRFRPPGPRDRSPLQSLPAACPRD